MGGVAVNPGLISLPTTVDDRGALSVCSVGYGLPFEPMRFFVLHETTKNVTRGGHAHRQQHQLLVCVSGEVELAWYVSHSRESIILDSPRWAFYAPPMTWIDLLMRRGAQVLVLASGLYESEEYLRDFGEFLKRAA